MTASGQGSTVARLRFEFLGDLAGYRESLKTAKTEGDAAAKTLGQSFRDALAKAPAAGYLAGLKQDLELGRNKTLILKDAATAVKHELASLSVKALHTGLDGVRNVLGKVKSAAGEVFKGLLIGTGIAAFQDLTRVASDLIRVIPDLVTKGKDYAEVVHEIQISSGGTAESVSTLTGVMTELGVPVDQLVNRLGRLAVSIETHEKELNALGVTTRDANGEFLTSTQLVDNMRSVFSTLPAGIAKARLEVLGFGRGALGEMSDYLTLTDPQLAAFADHAKQAGLIISDSAAEEAEAVTRAQGNINAAVTGLANTIFTAVGPTIVSVFDGIANAITMNAAAIAAGIQNVIGWITGLVSALTGIDLSGSSFTSNVMEMGGASATTSFKLGTLNAQLATLDEKEKNAKPSTQAATDALSAQTKAVDKQIKALTDLDRAEARAYETRLKAIRSLIDERTAALDAAEAARKLAQDQYDLNEQLNQAQIDLAEARAGKNGVVDANAVSSAMAKIADIQRQQADLVHEQAVDAQKAAIGAVKDYVDAIDQLVADSTDKVATLADLKKREAALTAGGKPAAGSDAAIELAAVLAAEQRVREQAANAAKQTALEAKKQALADETAAVRSAAQAQTGITREELLKQIAAEKAALAARAKSRQADYGLMDQLAQKYVGEKGSVTQAFRDFQKAGVDAGNGIKEALVGKDGKGGVFGAIGSVAGSIGSIANGLNGLVTQLNSMNVPPTARFAIGLGVIALGTSTANLGLITLGAGIAGIAYADARAQFPNLFEGNGPLAPNPGIVPVGPQTPTGPGVTYATGGPIRFGREAGEWVLTAPVLKALESLNRNPAEALAAVASGGSGRSRPVVIPLYLDGREIARAVGEIQADDYRR